ncbi:MAG TPA: NAD(P)/FAD-dependent oxidoreductase [Chloroflexota bacterium]
MRHRGNTTPTRGRDVVNTFGGTPDTRILILGGGFGGVYTALKLERVLKPEDRTEVTLISPENFFLFTPMLAEIVSSQIDTSHAINPMRRMFKRTRFVEGTAHGIDLQARSVRVGHPNGEEADYPFDHLVLATGAETSFFGMEDVQQNAYTAKTLGDAILLRNRAIEMLEIAEIERDPTAREEILTVVVAGGGFSGVELAGEMNDLIRRAATYYPGITQRDIRVILVEAKSRILPEFDERLARFAHDRLRASGVEVQVNTAVSGATEREVHIKDGPTIGCRTLVWTTGVAPNPLIGNSDLPKTGRGWVKVDAHMRVEGQPGVWALGDCAQIPNPLRPGQNQPALAQHGMREAARLGENIAATLHGEPTKPFKYRTLGQMATLGQHNGIGVIGPIRVWGFPAWVAWRSYYLLRLPRLEKQLRVATDWTVDMIFGRDISQIQTNTDRRPPSAAQ